MHTKPSSVSVRRAIPIWIVCLFSLSAIVYKEPAPFDVALSLAAFFFFIWNGWKSSGDLEIFFVSLMAFLLIQIPQIYLALDAQRAISFLGITCFSIFTAIFTAKLTARYGNVAILAIMLGYSGSLLLTFMFVIADKFGIVALHTILYYDPLRVQGFFKDPNVMGPAAVPMLLLAFPLADHLSLYGIGWGMRRMIAITLVFAATFLIYFSYSRGAWGAAIVGVFVYFMLGTIEWPSTLRVVVSLSMAIVGLILLAAPTLITNTMLTLAGNDAEFSERYASGSLQQYDIDRFAFQSVLISAALQNPEGSGPGQSEIIHRDYEEIQGSGAAHSSYVRIFFENGAPGLALYVFSLFLALKYAWLSRKNEGVFPGYANAIFCSMLSLIISGFTVDTVHWRHFWIIIGLSAGMYSVASKSRSMKLLNRVNRS
jgi:O-antigen ligase